MNATVRRTAEIFLCDVDDWEVILAKYGINGIKDLDIHKSIGEKLYTIDALPTWWDDVYKQQDRMNMTHRYMSNNSIMFREKPSKEMLDMVFAIMKETGEPGFVNLEAAQKRRPNGKGFNPCVEIILDNKGVCNLTTVNVMAFVRFNEDIPLLDFQGLMEAQALSTRAGIRMTCIDLELPEWDVIHKRDRLVGTSLTGWKDAMEALMYDTDQETNLMNMLSETAHNEAIRYAYILRIPTPLLVTTVKPEGTLSQVAGGVSSGLHVSHAPYFIRRIRINANDPLALAAKELNWRVLPEIYSTMENAKTLVVEFPIKSPAKHTRAEQTLQEQFDTYFNFQENYTAHNSSNTITVKDDEWDLASNIVYDKWDDFIGVAFLAYDGGNYELMPYEEIDEEEYETRLEEMQDFSIDLLHVLESEEIEQDLEHADCGT